MRRATPVICDIGLELKHIEPYGLINIIMIFDDRLGHPLGVQLKKRAGL
jgi:hypothetical protein